MPDLRQGWWQQTGAFAALGKKGLIRVEHCFYQGGWNGIDKSLGNALEASASGLSHGYPGVTSINVPWDMVTRLLVASPEEASKLQSASRLAGKAAATVAIWVMTGGIGVLASGVLAKDKSAMILIGTANGEEGVFVTTDYLAPELRAKLAPVLSHYAELPPRQLPPAPNAPSPSQAQPASQPVTEQIRQLAELRDSGILTEAEFQAKKTELLARM